MVKEENLYQVFQCPNCGAMNRIGTHSASVRPVCGRCKTPLDSTERNVDKIQATNFSPRRKTLNIILFLILLLVCLCIVITPTFLAKDFSEIIANEKEKTRLLEKEQRKNFKQLESRLKKELAQVDSEKLRNRALKVYDSILESRISFDKKYALTSREKALLNLKNLASDSTQSYKDALRAVAMQASPKGSEIKVSETVNGTVLQIYFDMSSLTSGEAGIRTKHNTKKSLKEEVISLISRVTNDIYQCCRDFHIEVIHIACRHYVATTDIFGNKGPNENMILYKVMLKKSKVTELTHNPFLDVFSTTKFL